MSVLQKPLLLVFALSWLASLGPSAGPAQARDRYRRGEIVRFQGRVVAADGAPLNAVTVLLEASRYAIKLRRISWRGLGREKEGMVQLPTTTTGNGEYGLDWTWDDYYNRFELVAALPVQRAGQPDYEVFVRIDVTERVQQGSPVEQLLRIEESHYLAWLRRYLEGQASADEMRIYREMGRPDQLHAEADETSWWFFAAGKVYYFKAGALRQVTHFDPVE